MGGKPPPPPDMRPYADASMANAKIAREIAQDQIAWAKTQHADNMKVLNEVLGVQLPIMQQQFDNAQEDRARYEEVFRPLEDEFIKEAQEYDTEERRRAESAKAQADVRTAYDAQRQNALSALEGYGVDPSTTRHQALDVGVRTAEAAQQAFAGNAAERRVEDIGRALRSDAINLGRGLPSQVAANYGQSVAAGQAGLAGANQTTGTAAGALQGGASYMGIANQGIGQAGNMINQGYQNTLNAWNAEQEHSLGSALGSVAGMAAGGWAAGGFKPFWGEEGGVVPQGLSTTPGPTDKYPAMLAKDEYVVPAEVVRAKGTEFFDKLKEKYSQQPKKGVPS